jgi:hypothetical protein
VNRQGKNVLIVGLRNVAVVVAEVINVKRDGRRIRIMKEAVIVIPQHSSTATEENQE